MKIEIVKIGKPNFVQVESLVETYRERLSSMVRIEAVESKDPVGPDNPKGPKAGESFKVPPKSADEVWVVLDEHGKEWTSMELAGRIRGWRDDPRVKTLKFVIGGPDDYDYAKEVLQLIPKNQLEKIVVNFSPVFSTLSPELLASWIMKDHLAVRLNLQLHKILWPATMRGV